MNKEELKQDLLDLVDHYYDELEECETLTDLYKLNWYCKDRLINMGYKAFNETWGLGYSVTINATDEEKKDEAK